MSVTFPCWARVSNAVEDPQSRTSVAQDEVVKLNSEDGDWYVIETLDGTVGRVPKILAILISNPLRLPSERVCCSIAQFDPQCDRDLPFGIYSIIVVESFESEGWLKGIVVTDNGKRLGNSGTFPASHVKELSDFTVPTDPQLSSGFSDVSLHGISSTSNGASNYVVGPYARAVYPFTGEFGNELTFQADEIISLTKRIDNDWLEGCVGGRSGIFPQSFVQIVVDIPGEVQSDKRNSTAEEGIGFAIVRHDFEGRQSDELSVKMGDSVRILKMVSSAYQSSGHYPKRNISENHVNADWVMCNDPGSDKSGIVPVAFLEMYLDEDEDETKDIVSRPHSIVEQTVTPTQSHEWAVFGEEWNMASEKKAVAPARPPPPKA
uniref:SH3 domain-containing GRB2-like protein n=1 Tax=Heterorhabditis bacteriophora TaxID=37862 RepID=A0A1I7X7V0_HETBA